MMSPMICAFHSYQVVLSYNVLEGMLRDQLLCPYVDQHTFEDSGLLLLALQGDDRKRLSIPVHF